ncbi:hypothetical protein Vretimale_12480 [Volvox reticuliferus]|uniref:Uncharacterized protein n=1 Tax=Volvox reticuliferus TaxID=1737510 RepID=A0A8J4GIK0_9CHLO|nr:hypothetical protein Vretimale_12480 [Volvox reticuliferus]
MNDEAVVARSSRLQAAAASAASAAAASTCVPDNAMAAAEVPVAAPTAAVPAMDTEMYDSARSYWQQQLQTATTVTANWSSAAISGGINATIPKHCTPYSTCLCCQPPIYGV